MQISTIRGFCVSFSFVSLIAVSALLVMVDEAGAWAGDRAAAYQRKINGGPGCVAGDCSHSKRLRNYAKKHGTVRP